MRNSIIAVAFCLLAHIAFQALPATSTESDLITTAKSTVQEAALHSGIYVRNIRIRTLARDGIHAALRAFMDLRPINGAKWERYYYDLDVSKISGKWLIDRKYRFISVNEIMQMVLQQSKLGTPNEWHTYFPPGGCYSISFPPMFSMKSQNGNFIELIGADGEIIHANVLKMFPSSNEYVVFDFARSQLSQFYTSIGRQISFGETSVQNWNGFLLYEIDYSVVEPPSSVKRFFAQGCRGSMLTLDYIHSGVQSLSEEEIELLDRTITTWWYIGD